MQSLNDDMDDLNNDMNELFRRAGEEYPLHTNGADWNKVMQQLHHTENNVPGKNKNKKNYRYLLLLLLLPVGFVCGRYVGNGKKGNDAETNKEINKNILRSDKTKPVVPSLPITGLKQKKAGNEVIGAEEAAKKRLIRHASANDRGKPFNNIKADNKIIHNPSITEPANSVSVNNKAIPKKGINDKTGDSLSVDTSEPSKTEDKNNIVTGKKLSDAHVTPPDISKGITLQRDTLPIADITKKADSVFNRDTKSALNKKSSDKKQKTIKRKFYYSIVIGTDVSTVKLQKTSRIGYSAGLMLGYRINNKISVDAGALWDRKNYYTEGKFLDTNRLKLPVPLNILNGTGYCDMIEIPMNVKYSFITKKDHSWFVSTGLSGYLMKYEYYNLTFKRYNTTASRDYGYKNSSKDWFSILNISAGYKKTLGKYSNISIEPYIKLPLRGVGIGKLPVSSTGVYISLSRSF